MPVLTFTDLSGGANAVDSSYDELVAANQTEVATNVNLSVGGLGGKRLGSYSILPDLSGGTALTTTVRSLLTSGTSGLWITDAAGTPLTKRWAGSSALIGDITFVDAISSRPQDIHGTDFNGKFFLSYTSAQDRLHVYDGSTVRRVGIAPGSNAPTVANAGAGSYAATLRYYRVRWEMRTGSVVDKKSEPTPSISFTPSGSGNRADVTQPTVPSNEGITHWRVEGSTDNVTFFDISGTIAVGTTSYSDSAAVTTYANNPLSEPTGYFTLMPSLTATVTDGNRIIGIASSKVYWTPVLGSLDRGDDERTVSTATQKPYLDLGGSGNLTAIARVVNGVIFVFRRHQVWRLSPTGDAVKPYSARLLHTTVGALNHKSVAVGEDETGAPVVYFLSTQGLYRVNAFGQIEYCGRDAQGITHAVKTGGLRTDININASTVVSHITYVRDYGQVFVFFARASQSANTPDKCLVFNVRRATRRDFWGVRGGWAEYTGDLYGAAVCSTESLAIGGATESDVAVAGRDMRLYIGGVLSSTPVVHMTNRTGSYQDAGTNYQGTLTTRAVVQPFQPMQRWGVRECTLVGERASGTGTMEVALLPLGTFTDQSTTTVQSTFSVSDASTAWKFDTMATDDVGPFQLRFGDSAAQNFGWYLHALSVRVEPSGVR